MLDFNTEQPFKKARRVESEEEKCMYDQQLKQASDATALLQDELIQAADRERQLQMQLNMVKEDHSQLWKWVEHRSNLQKDFDVFNWEQEMKQRDSRFTGFQ